jgi:hypothetical protein
MARANRSKRPDPNTWYKLRWRVLERDNFTCLSCGRQPPHVVLEVDHQISLADGGSNRMDNLRTCCSACHKGKTIDWHCIKDDSKRRQVRTNEHLIKMMQSARARHASYQQGSFIGEIEAYCRQEDCAAREVRIAVKEFSNRVPSALSCALCNWPLAVHHVMSREDLHKRNQEEALNSVLHMQEEEEKGCVQLGNRVPYPPPNELVIRIGQKKS